jgi:hypothetical protein
MIILEKTDRKTLEDRAAIVVKCFSCLRKSAIKTIGHERIANETGAACYCVPPYHFWE